MSITYPGQALGWDPQEMADFYNNMNANGMATPQVWTNYLTATANTPVPGSQQWAQQQLGLASALGPAQPAPQLTAQPATPIAQRQPVVNSNALPPPVFRYSAPIK